jgi:hypothetical protein
MGRKPRCSWWPSSDINIATHHGGSEPLQLRKSSKMQPQPFNGQQLMISGAALVRSSHNTALRTANATTTGNVQHNNKAGAQTTTTSAKSHICIGCMSLRAKTLSNGAATLARTCM